MAHHSSTGAIAIVLLSLAACGGEVGTQADEVADAGTPDAGQVSSPSDAAGATAVPIELSQNVSGEIKDGHSRVCRPEDVDAHYETSYYRMFDLPTHEVVGSLEVEQVDFAIQSAIAGSGSQEMRVRLHLLEGELSVANLTLVRQEVVVIDDQEATEIEVPIAASIPADAQLVVELFLPDGVEQGNLLQVGMNDAGETAPGYVRAVAAGCLAEDITQASEVGIGNHHLILRVAGTHLPEP